MTVQVVPQTKCRGSYGVNNIFDSMMCAGAKGKDSCQYESGGPAKALTGNYLVGIVSFDRVSIYVYKNYEVYFYGLTLLSATLFVLFQRCANPDYPDVYTRVSNYVNWIQQEVGKF